MKWDFRKDKVFVPDNGSIIRFTKDTAEVLKEKAPVSYVFVDGLGVGDVGEIVLSDRQALAEDGMFVIVAVIDKKTGQVKGSPRHYFPRICLFARIKGFAYSNPQKSN